MNKSPAIFFSLARPPRPGKRMHACSENTKRKANPGRKEPRRPYQRFESFDVPLLVRSQSADARELHQSEPIPLFERSQPTPILVHKATRIKNGEEGRLLRGISMEGGEENPRFLGVGNEASELIYSLRGSW